MAGSNPILTTAKQVLVNTNQGGKWLTVNGYGSLTIGADGTPVLRKDNQSTSAPGIGDDTADGYIVGSRWLKTDTGKEYVCSDASAGAAVWNLLN